MHICIPSHGLKRSLSICPRRMNAGNNIKSSKHHPRGLNVTTSTVGKKSLSCLSLTLADRWGTTVEFITSSVHSSRFSAFRSVIFHSRPVHSLVLSFHRFLCLPLHLPPGTVPCRIVLASPDDLVTCPYHFSLRLPLQFASFH